LDEILVVEDIVENQPMNPINDIVNADPEIPEPEVNNFEGYKHQKNVLTN